MDASKNWRRSPTGVALISVEPRDLQRLARPSLAVVSALLLAGCVADTTVAQAAQSPGLAFEDTRAWSLKWDVLKEPQRVNVCNVSGTTALRPNAAVSTLVAGEGEPVDVLAVRIDAPAGDKSPGWQAGECRVLVLTRTKAELDAGDHTGALAVTSSVGIARRTVRISGPKDVAKPAVAEGAVDSAELNATRGPLWGKTDFDGDGKLLLKPVTDKTIKVPPCDPSKPKQPRTPSHAATTTSATPQTTTEAAAPASASTPTTTTAPPPPTTTTTMTMTTENAVDGNCPFVGNIYNGTHVAKVFVASSVHTKDPEQPAMLKLSLADATSVGKYAGTIDLAGTPDNPKDDIKLSVNVKDHWLNALGALLIGALLFALLPQYILRRWNPKHRSYRRVDGFKGQYEAAITTFITWPPDPGSAPDDSSDRSGSSRWQHVNNVVKYLRAAVKRSRRDAVHVNNAKAAPGRPPEGSLPWQKPMEVDILTIAGDLRIAVKHYWRSTVYFDDTQEAYKELERSLEYVEDDIACLEEPERLFAKLSVLKAGLDELAAFLNTEFHTVEAPRFVFPIAALLKGPAPPTPTANEGTLKVGQALATADAADAGNALIASWKALADELVIYRKWWLRLKQDSEASNSPPSSRATWEPGHLARLNHARSWLAQTEHELLNVADANELAQFDTAADLKRAYGHLAYLSDLHGHWPLRHATSAGDEPEAPPAGEATTSPADDAAAYPSDEADWLVGSAGFAERITRDKKHTSEHWETQTKEVHWVAAEAPGLKDAKLRIVTGWFAVLLTASSAIVTALAAFYFSDTWGTTEDYLTIIVAAVLAQTVVQTITEAVGRTLLPMPKQLLTAPVAAILKPPAAKAVPAGDATPA